MKFGFFTFVVAKNSLAIVHTVDPSFDRSYSTPSSWSPSDCQDEPAWSPRHCAGNRCSDEVLVQRWCFLHHRHDTGGRRGHVIVPVADYTYDTFIHTILVRYTCELSCFHTRCKVQPFISHHLFVKYYPYHLIITCIYSYSNPFSYCHNLLDLYYLYIHINLLHKVVYEWSWEIMEKISWIFYQ